MTSIGLKTRVGEDGILRLAIPLETREAALWSGLSRSGWSIQGQRYGDPNIFADSFESGDLSVWSTTVP